MTTKENLKADMWCHFGKAVIRGPDQGNAKFCVTDTPSI